MDTIDLDELWAQIEKAGPLDSAAERARWAADADCATERSASQSARRRSFIARYAWAVPTREAIAAIKAFVDGRAVVEVCAGNGLWARLLTAATVEVAATDGQPPPGQSYCPLEVLEAEAAVRAHPECQALLLCWPPFRNDCAFRALGAFVGDRLVFVGDARFAADPQFHARLDQDWALRERVLIPAWPGLDDYAYFYSRA